MNAFEWLYPTTPGEWASALFLAGFLATAVFLAVLSINPRDDDE